MTARVWTLEFPGKLPPSLNDRLHWAARSRLMKRWKTMAWWQAKHTAGIPELGRIRVSALVRRSRLGVADEDNDRSRLKPILDGLVQAGVVKDDTRAYVELGTCTEERGKRALVVIVEEVA